MIVVGAVGLGLAMIVLASSRYLGRFDRRACWSPARLAAGAGGVEQYAVANDRRRRQAGPRDEPVCHGVHGHGPLRQPAGRRGRHRDRHSLDACRGRGVCIAAGFGFALHLPAIRPLIRPIYIAKGILPAIVADVQAATDMPADEVIALGTRPALPGPVLAAGHPACLRFSLNQ